MKIVLIKAEMQVDHSPYFLSKHRLEAKLCQSLLFVPKKEKKNLNNYWIDRHVNIIDRLWWQFQCHG